MTEVTDTALLKLVGAHLLKKLNAEVERLASLGRKPNFSMGISVQDSLIALEALERSLNFQCNNLDKIKIEIRDIIADALATRYAKPNEERNLND